MKKSFNQTIVLSFLAVSLFAVLMSCQKDYVAPMKNPGVQQQDADMSMSAINYKEQTVSSTQAKVEVANITSSTIKGVITITEKPVKSPVTTGNTGSFLTGKGVKATVTITGKNQIVIYINDPSFPNSFTIAGPGITTMSRSWLSELIDAIWGSGPKVNTKVCYATTTTANTDGSTTTTTKPVACPAA